MNDKRPDTPPPSEAHAVSADWLRVLDLGIAGEETRRDDSLAMNAFARLADCMP
jgi:hypothetical protein